jgi:hypothetical protein
MLYSYCVQSCEPDCQRHAQSLEPSVQLWQVKNKVDDLNKINNIIKSTEFYRFISSIARMAIMLQYVEKDHMMIIEENKIMSETMNLLRNKLKDTATYFNSRYLFTSYIFRFVDAKITTYDLNSDTTQKAIQTARSVYFTDIFPDDWH